MAAPLNPFPILRLPEVPLLVVLKAMDPMEVIAISRTSKKTDRIIRPLAKRIPFDLSVFAYQKEWYIVFFKGQIWCEKLEVVYDDKDIYNEKNTASVLFDYSTTPPTSICADLHEGFRDLIDFSNGFFSIKTVSVDIDSRWQFQMNGVLQHIKNVGLKMDQITLIGNGYHDEDIIEKCDGARLLHLSHPRTCKINSIHLERLVILTPERFVPSHLDTVLNSKSVVIKIGYGGAVIDEFFRKWMAGSYELEYFELTVNRNPFDLPRMVEGMEPQMVDRTIWNRKIHKFQPNECFRVRRADGVNAMVFTVGDVFIFKKSV